MLAGMILAVETSFTDLSYADDAVLFVREPIVVYHAPEVQGRSWDNGSTYILG